MFITLQNSIINIEEIRNAEMGSLATLWIYFRHPTCASDHLTLNYESRQELEEDIKKLIKACEEYNKNKIKN